MATSFMGGFRKTAATVLGMKPNTAKRVYKGLEYGGLGTLAALDAHEAYKGMKEGDSSRVKKGLLGTAALGGLMAATHIGSKIK